MDTVSMCKSLSPFFFTSYSLEIIDTGDKDGNGIGTYRVHYYQDSMCFHDFKSNYRDLRARYLFQGGFKRNIPISNHT